jgi:hypothetical protein
MKLMFLEAFEMSNLTWNIGNNCHYVVHLETPYLSKFNSFSNDGIDIDISTAHSHGSI